MTSKNKKQIKITIDNKMLKSINSTCEELCYSKTNYIVYLIKRDMSYREKYKKFGCDKKTHKKLESISNEEINDIYNFIDREKEKQK